MSKRRRVCKNDIQDLGKLLQTLGCFEAASRDELRRQILDDLEQVLRSWSDQVLNRHIGDPSDNLEDTARPVLVTFGSYRLAVHGRDSDMDCLSLSPPHCSSSDFFGSLVAMLKNDARVTHLDPIPTAYTPVIKFRFHGIKVDMLFVRLSSAKKLLEYQKLRASIGSHNTATRFEYFIDDSDLVGLDPQGIRSINGARVSQRLLEIVPSVEQFRLLLKAVKKWADIHGVQSNVLGFLGGINWAILAAWVCVRYPQADPSKLFYLFFGVYGKWKWPEPVLLEQPSSSANTPPNGVPRMPIWDPDDNPRDGLHLMPIITPSSCYPAMNSSYSVGIAQMRRMQDEMWRTAFVLEDPKSDISQIFRDCGFFRRHHNFLQIVMSAITEEDLLLWSRFCETKLRILINNLESDEVQPWPFAKFFQQPGSDFQPVVDSEASESGGPSQCWESYFFIALRFAPGIEHVDLRSSTFDFLSVVNSWEGRQLGMDLKLSRITANDLPLFALECNEFKG